MTELEIKENLSCGERPNCVSSVAFRKNQFVEPINYSVETADAKKILVAEIQKNPQAAIIAVRDGYIHATFTSKIFKFVDDVEFVIDHHKKRIHFRSRSRIGYYDLGANRKRMLAIKSVLQPLLEP